MTILTLLTVFQVGKVAPGVSLARVVTVQPVVTVMSVISEVTLVPGVTVKFMEKKKC